MATRAIQLAALTGVFTHFLVGCTVTTNLDAGGNPIPVDWSPVVAIPPEECVSIDGEYQTYGIGKFSEGKGLTQARLDAALGYVFPSGKIPRKVSISLGQESGSLNLQFGQPINRSFSMPASCLNGWYKVEQILTNQYLGDGTTLDYSISEIELGKSVDGDLILHSSFEIQSSSFLMLKSRDMGESWSKFAPYENQN